MATRKVRGTKSKKRGPVGGVHRGEEGRRRVEQELNRSKQQEAARKATRDEPFRFRLAPGESKQFIVVDEEPWFFRYEHTLKDPKTGFYNVFLGCVRDYDNCPICEGEGKEGSYNMYLTVIDLTEFTDKKDNVHEFSRKMLVVKSRDQNKFLRRFDTEGTLRGALFETHRDKDTDPAIGNDIEFLEMLPEEELEEYVREYEDRDGKGHTEDCSEPYDYEKIYEEKSTEELAELYSAVGGDVPEPSPGSRRSNQSTTGKGLKRRSKRDEEEETSEEDESEEAEEDASDDDSSAPWEDESEEADDSSEEDESVEEEPVTRRTAKTAAKRAVRTTRKAVDKEKPAPRRASRREKVTAPATRRGRR